MKSIGGWTRGPITAKLLYAGAAKGAADPAATRKYGAAEIKSSSASGDVAQISDAAKAASDKIEAVKQAPSLKDRVEALFQEAKDRGTFITFDSSKGGEWMDMSSFTDDELAQITNDKAREYPQELSDYAGGTLGARLKVVLEPYEDAIGNGDRRGHAMTINRLYEQMSPELRQALNWTPAMMVSNNNTLDEDVRQFGPYDSDAVIDNLLGASGRGGLGYSVRILTKKR